MNEAPSCCFCKNPGVEPWARVLVGDVIGGAHTDCLAPFVAVCRLDGTRVWLLVSGVWKRAS